jgi:serine/threonine-protein kinase
MPRAFTLPIDLGPAYRIERELGGGGMSRVFLATELALGRPVAVKVLPPELSQGVSQERFRREIQMAASLQHPHIVPLLTAGDAGGALYYTMPMVDGESLREVFKREERPAVADVVRILHDVAEALAYAHSRGVVHRDIKPDNVLLVNGAHALVVDFGVAKAITSARDEGLPAPHVGNQTLTSQGIALGTPSYMAPEQAAADPNADHRMDIYALGALGYEMLRGAPLFSGMSPASVLAAQVSKQPEPLEREAHVPESLYAVIERCLAKMPDDRFASAADLAQALTDVNTDLVLRTPSSGGSRVARNTPTNSATTRQRPRWRVFAEVAVLFVAIAALGSFVRDGFSRGIVDGTTLRERDEVLVANFADAGSGLGAVVSDALRTDLTQSTLVRVVQPVAVRDALERMQREPTAAVDSSLAREVALREGIPAYVVGDVRPVGRGFQLTARLISADSGLVLAAVRESASDSGAVIGAIDKLSKGLRRILGESMRALSAAPPLDRVTTPSLEALRRYTQAVAAVDVQGDYPRGYRLLEEAIALDPNFAMAMRKLSAALSNRGQQPERARQLLAQAMEHRDRLTPVEAHLLEGSWYSAPGPQHDERRAMAAYDAVIALDSTDKRALNNLAILHMDRGDYARAEVLLRRAVDGSASALQMSNLVEAQAAQGKLVDARGTADQFLARFPSHPMAHTASASVSYALGDLDGTERSLMELRRIGDNDLGVRRMADGSLSALFLMRGRLAAADSTIQAYMRADPNIEPRTAMAVETRRAITRAWFLGDASGAARQLDAVRAQFASYGDSAVVGYAPLLMLARAYALSGRTERARELLREYRRRAGGNGGADSVAIAITEAEIALQSRDYARAVAMVRDFPGFQRCPHCLDGEQARVYDMAGDTDSALVRYGAFVQQFRWSQLEEDVFLFGPALKRLGEMHEERGQKEQAASYYVRFLDLYARADRELQPQIDQVRSRLSRLKPV